MAARVIFVGVIAALLAGCWPARFAEQPGVIGAVVSAVDGKPVAGASVRLIAPLLESEPLPKVITDREGRFQIEPLYHWGIYSFLGEGWPVQGRLEIDAAGFASGRLELSWPQTGPQTKDVGVIELMPP
jgi:hypothetical protein